MTSPDRHTQPFCPSARRRLPRTMCVLGLTAAILLPGCKKEEPPPPPPPPPPPIIMPDPVDIQAIRQELGADARVQIASGVETTERDLAEAVIRFADAWAKGDASALRTMLSRGDRAILEDLRARGEWDPEVRAIEQVRIVYLTEDGSMIAAAAETPEMPTATPQDLERALANVPAEMRESMRQMMASMSQMGEEMMAEIQRQIAENPELIRAQIEQLRSISPEQASALQAMLDGEGASVQVSGPVVTLALQQPSGSYVLAWNLQGSPGNYTFASLHTIDRVRRRASEWDGQPGLAGMVTADAPETPAEEGVTPAQQPGSEGGEDQPFGTPGQKNTPVGPVTIPGGT